MESLTRSTHHHTKRKSLPAIQQDRNAIAASQDLSNTSTAGFQHLRHTAIEPAQSVGDRVVLRRNAPRRHRNGPSTSLPHHMEVAHGICCGCAVSVRVARSEQVYKGGDLVVGEGPVGLLCLDESAEAASPPAPRRRIRVTESHRRPTTPANLGNPQGAPSKFAAQSDTMGIFITTWGTTRPCLTNDHLAGSRSQRMREARTTPAR